MQTLSPDDRRSKILLFWIILSDRFLLMKIVPASLDKNPKIGQNCTSDLATNLRGKIDHNIGISI